MMIIILRKNIVIRNRANIKQAASERSLYSPTQPERATTEPHRVSNNHNMGRKPWTWNFQFSLSLFLFACDSSSLPICSFTSGSESVWANADCSSCNMLNHRCVEMRWRWRLEADQWKVQSNQVFICRAGNFINKVSSLSSSVQMMMMNICSHSTYSCCVFCVERAKNYRRWREWQMMMRSVGWRCSLDH